VRDTDLARAWEAYAGDKRPDSPHRCALIVHYLDFSERLARKLHARVPRTVDVHDLAQIAAMALVTQVDTFDYTVNDRFDLYASRYITGRMLDHLRSLDPLSRHTRKVVAVAEALEDMDFATQYIVALKYYLNQSLSSIAESTGLPETVVSRLHAKAVERVRETVVKIVVESGAEA
jgi:DNA-directed RNA polymerase specialized sigma subunit